DEHQREVAEQLAEVDGGLVTRRQPKAFPAVVIALDDEGPPEAEQTRQDQSQPEQSRQGDADPVAIGTERELEDEEQEQREEEQRVQTLLRAALGEQVLPEDGQRAAGVRHHAVASWPSVRLS